MSSILGSIGPEQLELFALELGTMGACAPVSLHRPDFSVTLTLSQTTKIFKSPKLNAA